MSDEANDIESAKKRRTWSGPSLALEFFSVLFGVLLALALSEWAEDREHRKLADAALVNISQELRSNLEVLTLIHDNNAETVALIAEPQDGEEERNIIPGMQLQETAWNTLLTTGLSAYVDYETVLTLSNTYALQDVYKQTGMQLVESTMAATAYATASGTSVDEEHFKTQYLDYFRLLVQIESQLLEAFATTIGALET